MRNFNFHDIVRSGGPKSITGEETIIKPGPKDGPVLEGSGRI
jgi:hypothetical protein